MKKNILIISAILGSFITISGVSADCLYQKLEPSCSIAGQTYTNSCEGWSDTSSWSIPVAYQGECKNTVVLDEKTKKIISDYFYDLSLKKEYIISETDEYYRISKEGKDHIQYKLFPVIQLFISEEINKTSPDFKKIAILNYFVNVVGYDYSMKK